MLFYAAIYKRAKFEGKDQGGNANLTTLQMRVGDVFGPCGYVVGKIIFHLQL